MKWCAGVCIVFVIFVAAFTAAFSIKSPSASVGGRIIGGQEADPGQFPFQAALRINITGRDNFGTCGGSLISPDYVITAAHCVLITNIDHIEVHLGAHNIYDTQEEGRISILVPKENMIAHENYNPRTIENDVALLKLTQSVTPTAKIQFLELPTYSDVGRNLEDQDVIAVGWGRYSDAESGISDVLKFMKVHVEKQKICHHFYWEYTSGNICTYTGYGEGVCNGDSGGPLLYTDNTGRTILVGLSSYVSDIGCVVSGWPSVYVRVTYFLDWIAANSNIQIKP